MKPATDVISRLRCNAQFSKHLNDFIVGYVDGTDVIVEQKVTEFNWEDDASLADSMNGKLAIPQYHIVNFKYKDYIVWDKPRCLDFIFGSTGNNKIGMKKLHQLTDTSDDESECSFCTIQHHESKSYNLVESSSDNEAEDSDDLEEMELALPRLARRAAIGRYQIKRVTHFLAIRITNGNCLQKLTNVFDFLKVNEPKCIPFLHTPEMLHFTILTLRLTTYDEVIRAVSVARSFAAQLKDELPLLNIEIEGLAHFHKKILHAKVSMDDFCTKILLDVRKQFSNSGLDVTSKEDDVPHVSLAKLPSKHHCKIRKLITSNSELLGDLRFGSQDIDNVNLCLDDNRRDDGFYPCAFENTW